MRRDIYKINLVLIILIITLSLGLSPVNAQYVNYGGLYGGYGSAGFGLYGGGLYGGYGSAGYGLYGGGLYGGYGSAGFGLYGDGVIVTNRGNFPYIGPDWSRIIWSDEDESIGYDPITGAGVDVLRAPP